MARFSVILAVAVCAALSVAVSARVQILYTTSFSQPLNTRTADTCAANNLFNAFFNGAVSPTTYGYCPNGPSIPTASSTIVAPAVVSTEGYSTSNTYTVLLNGVDFGDLFTVAPNVETGIGTIYLSSSLTGCSGFANPYPGTTLRPLTYVSNTQLRFDIQPAGNSDWLSSAILLQNSPIPLCISTGAPLAPRDAVFTGLYFGAVYSCVTNAGCGAALDVTSIPVGEIQRRLIQGLTQCAVGRCINPNVQGVCGNTAGVVYTLAVSRCCDNTRGTIALLDQGCVCRRTVTNGAPVCPPEEPSCCLPTKFQELVPICTGNTPNTNCATQVGQCYNPISHQCCDTGAAFDPGSQQCCSISGLTSASIPCPCETDLDCGGGNTQDAGTRTPSMNQRCCTQTAPERGPVDGQVCSAYQNFPTGQVSVRGTRCRGTCFDVRFQICCNGATCVREFEQCCNATCCNVFTSSCFTTGRTSGTGGNINNGREFALRFTRCSSQQNLETVSVFWVYIIPAAFLISTLGTLALALVFTSKAAVRMFSLLEKMIIAVGVIVTVVSCTLYFSPVYKYGIIFSLAAIMAIIASAARVRWVTVLALIAVGISAWYLLDPWHGNDYLTLAYWRLPNGLTDPRAAGLFQTLSMLFPARDQITNLAINQCVVYYNYFALDPLLQDQVRFNNPEVTTFGYCTRGWITALLVFAGILWASLVFLFALLVLALILRFRKDRSAPIELEVRPEPFLAGPGYGAATAFVDPYAAGAYPYMPAY